MEIKIGDKVLVTGYGNPTVEGKVLNIAKHLTNYTSNDRTNRLEYKYLVGYIHQPTFGKTTQKEVWFDEDFVYKIKQ